jgi:hypothetical protein
MITSWRKCWWLVPTLSSVTFVYVSPDNISVCTFLWCLVYISVSINNEKWRLLTSYALSQYHWHCSRSMLFRSSMSRNWWSCHRNGFAPGIWKRTINRNQVRVNIQFEIHHMKCVIQTKMNIKDDFPCQMCDVDHNYYKWIQLWKKAHKISFVCWIFCD